MNFVYNERSKGLSLQSLTTTKIIQKLLEDEGMRPNREPDARAIASRVIKVVNNLPKLPPLLKWLLRRMVLPIMEEMQSWYQYRASQVVLTQNGTVDLPRSINDTLNNENVSLMQRFKVACDYCLEQEIFDIGAQINFPNDFGIPETDPYWKPKCWGYWANRWALARIWYTIYEGKFHAKLSLKDISEYYCTKGFVQAFYMSNSAGVKYFVEGVSPSEIGYHILSRFDSMYYAISFTPDTCIKMFKRCNEIKRQQLKSYFSTQLLEALLRWPFQHQFLKAVESLAKNMDRQHFLLVAAMISNKARYGWEDHDYKDLFIGFWKLRSESKIRYSKPACHASHDMLYDVILMRDERLAHLVLDNTTETFKIKHLFHFFHKSVGLRLIFEKHFEALELFVEVCRENNDKLIVKFQKDSLEFLDPDARVNYELYTHYPIVPKLEIEDQKNLVREFLSRMDKLKPQMSEISI